MPGRLFTALSVLSLLAGLVAASMWLGSHDTSRRISREFDIRLQAERKKLIAETPHLTVTGVSPKTVSETGITVGDLNSAVASAEVSETAERLQVVETEMTQLTSGIANPSPNYDRAIMFAGILPLLWIARFAQLRHVERKRVRGGLCPDCGYDLRATTGRCPECGTEPIRITA